MKIVCEGCGVKISKSEQIRHDTMACENPQAKCKFCNDMCHLKDLNEHMRSCAQRAIVKMEYFPSNHFDEEAKQEDLRKKIEFRDYPGQQKGKQYNQKINKRGANKRLIK